MYAKTREEVEPMLEKMIGEVRERIKGKKEGKKYTALTKKARLRNFSQPGCAPWSGWRTSVRII